MKTFAWLALFWVSPTLAQEGYPQIKHHWDYDASAPLNVKQAGSQARAGVMVYDISFSSPVGNRAAAVGPNGGVVTAFLIVPPGKGPFPAVIYGHWCMPGSEKKNRTEFLEEAIVLAHSGVISLLPNHVSVNPGFVEDNTPMNENQVAVAVQQVTNLRRGADLLRARKDVEPTRMAYVGHSCDASAGGFLSGIDRRFSAFVLMAGGLSDEADKTTNAFQEYRQKVGPEKLDAFMVKFDWMDVGKYTPHAAPAAMFLQYALDEPFLTRDLINRYFDLVGEPKTLKTYQAPHALNAEATSDRISFLAEKLSFKVPDARITAGIPALVQPPWPKPSQ